MKFKIGQKAELINNSDMAAPLGSIAIVCGVVSGTSNYLIRIKWKGNVMRQMDGYYSSDKFRSLSTRNKQLLFDFME